jgi:hypothetical protein
MGQPAAPVAFSEEYVERMLNGQVVAEARGQLIVRGRIMTLRWRDHLAPLAGRGRFAKQIA